MEEAAKQLLIIDNKVKKLIEQYNDLNGKVTGYLNEIEELKKSNHQLQLTTEELKEKNILIKIAKTTEKREGSVNAKLKINELIREIDRCIGLLQI